MIQSLVLRKTQGWMNRKTTSPPTPPRQQPPTLPNRMTTTWSSRPPATPTQSLTQFRTRIRHRHSFQTIHKHLRLLGELGDPPRRERAELLLHDVLESWFLYSSTLMSSGGPGTGFSEGWVRHDRERRAKLGKDSVEISYEIWPVDAKMTYGLYLCYIAAWVLRAPQPQR